MITPPAPHPTALSPAVDCATARKTTLVPVDGGDGLGMAPRKVTFFMVGGGGLGMARRTTYVRPFDPVFSASGL